MSHVETMIPPQPAPPGTARPVHARSALIGNVALGVWLAASVGLFLLMVDGWDPEKFAKYGPSFLSGLGVTLVLVGSSITLGAILSLPIAFGTHVEEQDPGVGSPMPMSISSAARR